VVWAHELTRPFLRTSAGLLRADGRLGQLGIVLAHQAWHDLHFGATRAAIAAASEAAQLAKTAASSSTCRLPDWQRDRHRRTRRL